MPEMVYYKWVVGDVEALYGCYGETPNGDVSSTEELEWGDSIKEMPFEKADKSGGELVRYMPAKEDYGILPTS